MQVSIVMFIFIIFMWGIMILTGTHNLPVVHWSVSEDRCVKVENVNKEFSCDNLPKKYERIWVK